MVYSIQVFFGYRNPDTVYTYMKQSRRDRSLRAKWCSKNRKNNFLKKKNYKLLKITRSCSRWDRSQRELKKIILAETGLSENRKNHSRWVHLLDIMMCSASSISFFIFNFLGTIFNFYVHSFHIIVWYYGRILFFSYYMFYESYHIPIMIKILLW